MSGLHINKLSKIKCTPDNGQAWDGEHEGGVVLVYGVLAQQPNAQRSGRHKWWW